MPSSTSRIIVAPAGSGKTTLLVEEALSMLPMRIAFLTYTNSNAQVIRDMFCSKHRGVPSNVDVRTWFRFLLHECARPYQRAVYANMRIRAIHFTNKRSVPFTQHEDTERFYFRNGDEVYSDKIARFVLDCEAATGGRVTNRLKSIYDVVLIDEFQDLAGYDLDVLEMLLRSSVGLILTGDPRQTTYLTNPASKNKRFQGLGILEKFKEWEDNGLCEVITDTCSRRCNQAICDFADGLWVGLEATASLQEERTGHDGVFLVAGEDLDPYMEAYAPLVLRYSKTTDACGYPAMTFGNAKGMTVDRVLVLPHGPIRKYLRTGDPCDVEKSSHRFYVAVTRARYSVAFLYDDECWQALPRWKPPASSGN